MRIQPFSSWLRAEVRLAVELAFFAPHAALARLEALASERRATVPDRRAIDGHVDRIRRARALRPSGGASCAFPLATSGIDWLYGGVAHAVVSPLHRAGASRVEDIFVTEAKMLSLLRGLSEEPAYVVPAPHLISTKVCELVGDSGGAALALSLEAARRGVSIPDDVAISAALGTAPDGALVLRPVSGFDQKRRVLERELPGCRFFFVPAADEAVEPSHQIELIPLEEMPFAALCERLLPKAAPTVGSLSLALLEAQALFDGQRYDEAKVQLESVVSQIAELRESTIFADFSIHSACELGVLSFDEVAPPALKTTGVSRGRESDLFGLESGTDPAGKGHLFRLDRGSSEGWEIDRLERLALSRLGAIELHAGLPAEAARLFSQAQGLVGGDSRTNRIFTDELALQIAGAHLDRFRPAEARAIATPIVDTWRQRLENDPDGLERQLILIAGLGCLRRLLLLEGEAEAAIEIQLELVGWSSHAEKARSLADLGECFRRAKIFGQARNAFLQARGYLPSIPLETYRLQTDAFLTFYEGRLALDLDEEGPAEATLERLRGALPSRSAAAWRLVQLQRLLLLRKGNGRAAQALIGQLEEERGEFARWNAALALLRGAALAPSQASALLTAAAAAFASLAPFVAAHQPLAEARASFVEGAAAGRDVRDASDSLLRFSAY